MKWVLVTDWRDMVYALSAINENHLQYIAINIHDDGTLLCFMVRLLSILPYFSSLLLWQRDNASFPVPVEQL